MIYIFQCSQAFNILVLITKIMHKGIKSCNVRRHAFLVYDSGIARAA